MEQNQISCGPVYEQLPPLSAKYQWFIAQSPDTEKDDTGDQFFYNIHEPLSHYRCRIPELLGKHIRGSFHGWLILSNDNIWSLWNPVSSKIIRLPRLNLKDGDSTFIKECCLSLPPEDPKSILLLTRTDKPNFIFCRLDHKRKKLRWIEMSYDKQLKRVSGDGCLLHSLSCCNGKVYALSAENSFFPFVIEIDIVVKAGEVVIELMLFAACPNSLHRGYDFMYLLIGYDTKLFCITIGFNYYVETDTTFSGVSLHKVDMTCINWAELEGLKNWDITGKKPGELGDEEVNNMFKSIRIWERMEDLKDSIFFVDLARDNSVVYSRAIASEFGGNIHIRSKIGKIVYSYNLNDGTILLNSMFPSPVLPTSHVSVWECSLAGDYAKSKQGVEDKDREIVVRLVTDDDLEINESQLLDLPFDILKMTMEFCTGLEYLNFRATCKSCHLATPVLQWRDEAALKKLQNYSLLSPWLMVVDKNRGIVTFEDPLSGYKYFMKSLPDQIVDGGRCYSGYGWLLFYSKYGLEFCNPFTNAIHDLPEVADCLFYRLCFSAPPTSPDCMVVGFGAKGIYIHFVGGEKSWRLVSLDYDDDDDRLHFFFPTLYGQHLYALCDDGELHVFKNLAQEDFSWKQDVVKAPRSCCRYPVEYFLTKCDQHLLLVFVDHFGESVEVFKLNDSTNEWEKTDSLGRHMIYISDDACLCIEAKMPEMEDKIFFARLYNGNGKVVFYSLKTGMYHTFNDKNIEESFVDFVGTKHYPFYPHVWIEPSWS